MICSCFAFAQTADWQQRVNYKMEVDMNVNTNRFTGTQQLSYWNNSPDTLQRVFFHLYFNAFRPGSMMDVRSRRQGTITVGRGVDWDGRVKDRILNLKPEECGEQTVKLLKMNGRVQQLKEHETILEVTLDRPILPKSKVVFDLQFEGQVPLQVRRSGRDNPSSGVRYSMSQWYPKICAYDQAGWHPTPYVGREFYGVWGNFDVKISIDKRYILGGTGYLQNPQQIGYGYELPGQVVERPAGEKLTWHFVAPQVHDFMWAADPEYIHRTLKIRDSIPATKTSPAIPALTLHLLYKVTNEKAESWEKILTDAARALPFIEKHFGGYPYKQYSFIHGGDGGMEYPMSTLLIGPGAWLHEWMHSWYQGVLATNESLYAWMDEGFTTFAEDRISAFLESDQSFAHAGSYRGYLNLAKSGREEPLTTHADHFNTNSAYSAAAYTKGAVFMEQLGYITGASVRDQLLLDYYDKWKFKHPTVQDLISLSEKRSGLKLDWYKEYWVNSVKTIDYAIDSLWEEKGSTQVRLKRIGLMPMPIDLQLTFTDGTKELHYIPLDLQYGQKPVEDSSLARIVYPAWKWTHGTYTISTTRKITSLQVVEIDPSQRLADLDRKNNQLKLSWEQPGTLSVQ
ncbi:MAG: M1 family metallopeptidase [Bacteroidetes bacterium]|nr:M1 family metallopeptidase [Bacteroidota bacterium]